jgi:hypothetical protein
MKYHLYIEAENLATRSVHLTDEQFQRMLDHLTVVQRAFVAEALANLAVGSNQHVAKFRERRDATS